MTPWLFRQSDSLYIGYDDEGSLGIKMDYTLRKKLAGVMIWEIGYDYNNELMTYVRDFITQVDNGAKLSNCAPSDAELNNIYSSSRNPNFFNRRGLREGARDGVNPNKPICSFSEVHEETGAAAALRPLVAVAAVVAAITLL
ncbi:hypothetical protein LPJ61_003374 [Coemansia biformis]|uniref:GH18 domain-containing protein n=1 Tax=Coemansia biformis TaxID=1286918 RepID=A0A9W7YBI6_9FUNG|nr:hypothetical protein LPJ61_003374 [Coemansia biformis]